MCGRTVNVFLFSLLPDKADKPYSIGLEQLHQYGHSPGEKTEETPLHSTPSWQTFQISVLPMSLHLQHQVSSLQPHEVQPLQELHLSGISAHGTDRKNNQSFPA